MRSQSVLLMLVLIGGGPVWLAGCDKSDTKVEKKEVTIETDNGVAGRALDKAGEATDKALHKAGEATDKALDRAGDATQKGLDRAGEATEKADHKVDVEVKTEH